MISFYVVQEKDKGIWFWTLHEDSVITPTAKNIAKTLNPHPHSRECFQNFIETLDACGEAWSMSLVGEAAYMVDPYIKSVLYSSKVLGTDYL